MTIGHSKRRFLFALELGGNFGHLARCLPIARKLQEQGHMVLFAVPDSRTAAHILAPHQLAFVEAPHLTVSRRPSRPPANYSEMLLHEGYRDTVALQGAVQAWLSVFQLFRPDVLIADHAPTAVLSGRIADLPTVALGSGFEIPPQSNPSPSMRPWEEVSTLSLEAADNALLQALNTVLQVHCHQGMQSVTELLGGTLRILATFPELDHYGPRPGEHYAGLFYEPELIHGQQEITWPGGVGARILVYMRPEMRCFASLLNALKASSHRVIFVAPGTHPSHVAKFSAPNLYFSHRSIGFAGLIGEADIAIGYGSIGFTTQTLRAGVPQLISPTFVEQKLCAIKVAEMGAGVLMPLECDAVAWHAALANVVNGWPPASAAKQFAEANRTYDVEVVAQRIAGLLGGLFGGTEEELTVKSTNTQVAHEGPGSWN